MRVLIVEDDEAIAAPLAKGLEREGLDVDRVETGAAALTRAFESGCDVVLLDLGLPDLDGFDVCRALRALCDVASSNPNSIDDLKLAAQEARTRGLITQREISAAKEVASCRELITSLF